MQLLRGNRWVTLAILCIGFLMILIDTTIVNVSIPTIIKDLNANLTDLEWVISGYALTFAALLITFGRLGDMYGRKEFFMLGLFVFTVSSYFCGEASSTTQLIAARLFQGVGGAMISPATLSIISSNFKGRERAAAFGIWGATAGIAVALGPLLGGYFTTYESWRWIFRVNIPIGIIGIIAAGLIIQESKDPRKQRIDISGMITSALGFLFLVFGLIEGQNYGWIKPLKDFTLGSFTWDNANYSIIVVSFVLSVIFLALFGVIQYVKTKKNLAPAVNVDFFKYGTYRYGLVAIGIIALGEFSSLFGLPIFLQSVHGFTPLQSGFGVLPLALSVMVAAPSSAKLVNKIGSKWVISTGIFIEFLGLFLLGRITADTTYLQLVPALIILGAGIGLAVSQNTQIILSEIPHEQSGSASGVLNTIRQVGTALGIAIVGAVLAHHLSTSIRTEINGVNGLSDTVKQKIIDQAASGNSAYTGQGTQSFAPEAPAAVKANPAALAQFNQKVKETSDDIKTRIDRALASSIGASIRFGSWFVLVGALLSLLIPNVHHKHEESAPAGH